MLSKHKTPLLATALVALGLLLMVGPGCAGQKYPSRAIEYVIPYSAGGSSDMNGRIQAKYLSVALGVPVNVTNQGGGNQIPAVQYAMGAAPDGYVLLSEQPSASSMHVTVKDLPYDILNRTYIASLTETGMTFCVGRDTPWKTLKEVADAVKKDPSPFIWARMGGTSAMDYSLLEFFDAAGADVSKTKSVSYDGAGPILTALAGGHVMFGSIGLGAVGPMYASGDIRVLALAGEKRVPTLPDVPTTAEAGFPGVGVVAWIGLSGPPNMPKDVVDTLVAASKKAVENPDFIKDAQAANLTVLYRDPTETRDLVVKEMDVYKKLYAKFY